MNEDNINYIATYTRAQAIEDGVLVDVTEQAKETGLLLPTFQKRAWARIIVAGFTMSSGWRTSSCEASKAKGSKRTIFLPNSR
jgi:hypothetical protein